MPQLILKSANIISIEPLIRSAINTQLKMITTGIKRTKARLQYFEHKYAFSTKELLQQESQGTIDDNDLEIIAWLGERKMLERLETEYQELVGIEICS